MSRLGDLIRTERLRQKMTPKQVAKKTGVSESFILAVEAGTRIIGDEQARRILRTIGLREQTEANFSLHDIAATVDLQQVQPRMAETIRKPQQEPPVASTTEDKAGVAGSVWLDALTSVLKRVPVMNGAMQPVAYRLLPIENGRIEGAHPDKVFYYIAPDDDLRGFRIHRDDVTLVVPAQSPVDGAVMLLVHKGRRMLRKIKVLDHFQIMLQSYGATYDSTILNLNEVTFLGRCVRVEIEL